jgi:hypothetical protein
MGIGQHRVYTIPSTPDVPPGEAVDGHVSEGWKVKPQEV